MCPPVEGPTLTSCRLAPFGGFRSHGDTQKWIVSFHGKSHLQMDDLGVPIFSETTIFCTFFFQTISRQGGPRNPVVEISQRAATTKALLMRCEHDGSLISSNDETWYSDGPQLVESQTPRAEHVALP